MNINDQAVEIVKELLLKNEYEMTREIVIESLLFINEYAKGLTPLYKAFLLENNRSVPKETMRAWIIKAENEF